MKTLWRVALVGPVVLYLIYLGVGCREQAQIDARVRPADGLVWGQGEQRLAVEARASRAGETEQVALRIVDVHGVAVFEHTITIDWDLFGGGLVARMQVDDDPEDEIVAFGRIERTEPDLGRGDFVLDYEAGQVRRSSLDQASSETHLTLGRWYQYHVLRPVTVLTELFALGVYYAGVGAVALIVRAIRRRRNRASAEPVERAG
jgi:hypothetical protein